jgi:crotonobetainyl-CoA:carnitine CoA-transferase CaiB-like acyl-CoA transferase
VSVNDEVWSPPVSGPLLGVHVLDFSQAAAGPFCSQHLGDLGATVTKIEPPNGDMIRGVDDATGCGLGTYFMGLNRNKRFMRIDLGDSRGRDVARRLARTADVLLENYRPGVMTRLGLGYEEVRADNPRLVYTSITAFGEEGPLRDKPGMDIIVQGFAGLMGVTGLQAGPPVKVGAPVADLATGYAAAMATAAALYERERSGRGQRVSLSLMGVVVSLLSNVATGHLLTGEEVPRMGSAHPQLVPYQAFRGADDSYLVIGILNERFWGKLIALLDDPSLSSDPRFRTNEDRVQHRDALIQRLEMAFSERTVAEWSRLCEEHDVPYTRVNSLSDLFGHPQAHAEGLVVELAHPDFGTVPTVAQAARFERTGASYHAPPAPLGSHTEQVLAAHGFSASEVAHLQAEGVV